MPRRKDLNKILLIGSGPITIGQACEFDYSGTQACKVLKSEGINVVLINSNPATIMTDPEFSNRTYIEPITVEFVEKVIRKEMPDAILPTLGGQTGLNIAIGLHESGALKRYGVELIGANIESIYKAESRDRFKEAMERIGLKTPKSGYARSLDEAVAISRIIGFPVIIRPSFTLGGTGGGIAFNLDELMLTATAGLDLSPKNEILIEQSIIGWKEFELEVMRDFKDNVVIVCSIENFDPMGIHTGDSITVAPAQTLTDKEYQAMRDASIAIMREIGVQTGGSNIQFAVNPVNGDMVVIEMNPRVSRSSALASKATGFPIAKIATLLAIGYSLDEIPNDITKKTPSCFEPALDYVVVKVPRWSMEKFPGAEISLNVSMKSVGEVMAIGRTFKEALQKAIRSLETGRHGLGSDNQETRQMTTEPIEELLRKPTPERIFFIKDALKDGLSVEKVSGITKVDPWFISNINELVDFEEKIGGIKLSDLPYEQLRTAKQHGYSDMQIAFLTGSDEASVRKRRLELNIKPTYKVIDTCAAEFESSTPYLYSTYEQEDESNISRKKKVVIIGSGPSRIGQGIEFDYCCVHASMALKELGIESIMINCNPETVSTDYDTSDKLYFEPLTYEDVKNIIDNEKPHGIIVQLGGQTPLKLSSRLHADGIRILGTPFEQIDIAEDRSKFRKLLNDLKIPQPPSGIARNRDELIRIANRMGFPLLLRPSYVLGGALMRIIYEEKALHAYLEDVERLQVDYPILIDKFLEDAIELDVDALADGDDLVIGAILEHIEEAGIHSGDSACVTPPYSVSNHTIATIEEYTSTLARKLKIVGLLNVQYAVKNDVVYALEVNPRASRTVPFISKATGIPMAKIATKLMLGKKLYELGVRRRFNRNYYCVKEAVLPFNRFPGSDTLLGPEMKSTGEVMGMDTTFGRAYAKSQVAANVKMPEESKNIFISVCDRDKRNIIFIAKKLKDMGFKIFATDGTGEVLSRNGVPCEKVLKIREGRPNVLDLIKNGEIDLIINTPMGNTSRSDGYYLRTAAVNFGVPSITTLFGASAFVQGIESYLNQNLDVKCLQDYLKEHLI
jgi:carbamoyl-phosphate synthase large subunit